jgi:ABC-2 type transport system ATP-binding protein
LSVKVEHISKMYGSQLALDEVSFEIHPGEIVGLLGPNGAGKSTLMKILSCYITASSGRATVCGFDTQDNSLNVRSNIGYLPEHTPLYLDMYVKEYLAFTGGLYGIKNPESRIKETIDMTGLGPEQHKKIGALSKGYRQRVGLAQALVHDPKVLILDEPTSGLDPNQLIEIRKLITTIAVEKTIIFSTHILQEVTAICNRVLIINKGKIVADATADAIKNAFQEENIIVVEFDKEVPIKHLQQLDGLLKIEALGCLQWKVTGSPDTDLRSGLFQFAVQNNLILLSMQKETQNLESVFRQFTQN